MPDVFEQLAKKLNALPEQIQLAYEEATIESVDKAAETLKTFFSKNSNSSSLISNMTDTFYKIDHEYYERTIDWDDTKIVNVDQGKSYGRDAAKQRASKKRNYSLRPATYHDLAYIINYGHGAVAGNYFITRGMRRVKDWQKKRNQKFEAKLDIIGNKIDT